MSAIALGPAHEASDSLDLRAANAALVVIMIATLAANLDSTTVSVALPHIRADLAPGGNVSLVVTAYFVGTVLTLPAVGWLAARFGPRLPFMVCVASFGSCAVLSASAWSLPTLIAARFVQGMTAMAIIPLGMTVVMTVFPVSRRGRAMAIWSIAGLAGPAFGPTLGGRVADAASWRLVLLAAMPLCAIAFFRARTTLPSLGGGTTVLDVPGLLLGPAGLVAVLLAVSQGAHWGWSSRRTMLCLVGGLLLLAVFGWWELRTPHPLLQVTVLRRRAFLRGVAIMGASTGIMTARLVFVPLQLADVRHATATHNGLLLLPVAFAMLAGTQVSGRMSDIHGPRGSIIVGAAFLVAGSVWVSTWQPSTPDVVLVASMAVQAVGNGAVSTSCTVLAMSRLQVAELGQGSTLRQLFQQLGATSATAAGGAFISGRIVASAAPRHLQSVYDQLAMGITGLSVLCLVVALGVPSGVQRPDA